MAGAGGVLLDDPVDASRRLALLTHGLGRCGLGQPAYAHQGAVRLVHVPLDVDGDDSVGPGIARRGPLLAAWDGRLDNGDEIRRACGGDVRETGDLACVLAAWERWGLDALARLVGDFALAVWDAGTHRLVLARDGLGTRPLFYAHADGGLLWGSSLLAVRRAAGVSRAVDERWLGGFLVFACEPESTPWREVRAVAPGHALVVEPGVTRTVGFWYPEPGEPLCLRDDREHEERLRELLVEAVRCRLRGRRAVAADLSGGLDSSSIVVLADRLLRDGRAEAPELVTLSHVYERAAGDDESEFMQVVEAHTGRPAIHIHEAQAPLGVGFGELEFEAPSLFQIWRARQACVRAALERHGAQRVLSGFGGDHLMRSEQDVAVEPAEHLSALRLRAYFSSLLRWRAASRAAYPRQTWPKLLWRGSVLPLLPYAVRTRLWTPPLPGWLEAGFVARVDLRARVAARVDTPRRLAPGRRRQVCAVEAGIGALAWLYDTGSRPFEQAYPLLDRRVVDFCLNVPIDQFLRPQMSRSLHRRALRGDLPARIFERHGKRGPNATMLRAVSECWGEFAPLLDHSRLAARGLVDEAALVETLRRARFGQAGWDLMPMLKALALEVWLRANERPDADGEPEPMLPGAGVGEAAVAIS
ncbi:MAG: asparagine synthetase B family protein [Thermoanaerobaculia bacterium]